MQTSSWHRAFWSASYGYAKDGNISSRTINSNTVDFEYDLDDNGYDDCDLTTKVGSTDVSWDKNGNMTDRVVRSFVYDDNNKLRFAETGSDGVEFRYDPRGNRVYKAVSEGEIITQEIRYIVDIVGKLPIILCEIDVIEDSLENSYVYAGAQILVQYTHNADETINEKFYYVHDRLGSVRLMVDYDDTTGVVSAVNTYTYNPFGDHYSADVSETPYNPFQFAGQWYDPEISQYYLRARQYDPFILRFTSRDPVKGKYAEPLMLHAYLYCANEPVNHIDPDGRIAFVIGGSFSGNITAADLGSLFVGGRKGMLGIGAMAAYYGVILPGMTMAADHIGFGGTAGAGFVAAWDHTRGFKSLTDRDAWSWGTIQWGARGGSVATGSGGSLTADFAISLNARRAGDLAGGFTEYGGSVTWPAPVGCPFFFGTGGLTYALGDNGIELWTLSGGAAYSTWGWGVEGHRYRGHAWVQEYEW